MNPTQKHDVPRTKLSLARAARDEALRQRDELHRGYTSLRAELADVFERLATVSEECDRLRATQAELVAAFDAVLNVGEVRFRTNAYAAGVADRINALLASVRIDRSGT